MIHMLVKILALQWNMWLKLQTTHVRSNSKCYLNFYVCLEVWGEGILNECAMLERKDHFVTANVVVSANMLVKIGLADCDFTLASVARMSETNNYAKHYCRICPILLCMCLYCQLLWNVSALGLQLVSLVGLTDVIFLMGLED